MSARKTIIRLLVSVVICLIAVGWFAWISQTSPRTGTAEPSQSQTVDSPPINPFLPPNLPDRGWPFVRGPDFDGRSAEVNLADEWPSEGPPVLWTRALGQGYSAFTAAAGRVFTQYQTLAGQFVICLDAETGQTLWEYRYDWPYEAGGVYPGPRATPTLADHRVYFASPTGLVGCLSWEGQLLWQVETQQRFSAKGADFGYSCSPTVHEGLVWIPVGGPDAALVALDARDGATRWRSGDDRASHVPALPISVEGHPQVIGYLENTLAAFDRNDGRLLWRMELSQGYDEHAAWPIYVEPYLWISAPFRWGSSLLQLSGGKEAAVREIWHSNLLANDIFSSVCDAGSVYGFDLKDVQAKLHRPSRGVFRCIDLETGTARWETERTGHASVLVADGKLILFNDQGELILARANPDEYVELARVSVLAGEICWTSPALHRGRLFVRNQHQAACLYLGRPELRQTNGKVPALTVADIPQGKYHDLAGLLGVEPEYAFDVPSPRWLQLWHLAGLALLLGAAAVAAVVALAWRLVHGEGPSPATIWTIFWGVAFVAGAVATTPLSLWRNEFIFTWPVSLLVAFQAAMEHVQIRRRGSPETIPAWRSRLVLLAFLAVCVGYYLACRRLSLVFEWVFLSGFAAAIPVALAGRWLSRRSTWPSLYRIGMTAASFSAYYWSSVVWLWWKYPQP